MTHASELDKFIDVICQYSKDGKIIPLRVKLQDDDGIYHEYNIKKYKEITHAGDFRTPYGFFSHSLNWEFLCQIQVINRMITIHLFFNGSDQVWRVIRPH